jgi:Helix-turn-helix domain of transposase family ISL3
MRVTTWHSTDYWGSRAPVSQTSRSPQTAWSSRSRCAAGGSPALLRPGGRRSPRPLFAALAPPRSRGPAPLPRVRPAADRCPDCGVRVEAVPFAHPRARHTRDFEDFTAFLGQQLAKTPIASLLRVGWDTVGAIVERVVCDHLDERRLYGLVQIGWTRSPPPRPALPHLRRRPQLELDRLVAHGPLGRDLAGLLRRALRAQGVDPCGLDRHVGGL